MSVIRELSNDNSYKYKDIANNNSYIWDIVWQITTNSIAETANEYIRNFNGLVTAIMALPEKEKTFDNTIWLLEHFAVKNEFDISNIIFLHYVTSDEALRMASIEVEKQIRKFEINTNMRKDLYNLYKYIYENEKDILGADDIKFMEYKIKIFERNGLHLFDDVRTEIQKLNEELVDLCAEFNNNIIKDNTVFQLSKKKLLGLPDEFFENLKKVKTKYGTEYIFSTNDYNFVSILDNAELDETRSKVNFIYNTRCKENKNILYKIIKLRQNVSGLLGYKNWADYVLDINMAKNSSAVSSFLENLAIKLEPLKKSEINNMQKEKGRKIYSYDFKYYLNKLKRDKYLVDQNIIKNYFPLDNVLKYMFKYFETLLNIRFTRGLKESWHIDVWEWLVYDNATSKIIGKFYFDLFVRENKLTTAGCFPLKHRTLLDKYAVCAVLCNFAKPVNMPLLLTHSEVESLYHEVGHVMHNICSLTKYINFSGSQTQRDFVEMPSQMLENVCWEFKTIKELSCHYETKEQLSDELVLAIIESRYIGSGISNTYQLILAMIDQIIHTRDIASEDEIINLYNKLWMDMVGIPNQAGTFPLSTFGHLVSGYGAQYYGYMWSKVYADDIYYELTKNKNVAATNFKYRKLILEPGGSIDAIDIVCNFLDRKPNNKAFLKNLGLIKS